MRKFLLVLGFVLALAFTPAAAQFTTLPVKSMDTQPTGSCTWLGQVRVWSDDGSLYTCPAGTVIPVAGGGSVTVRSWDYDYDGTLEMDDLQAIATLYGAGLHLIVTQGDWLAPDDSANLNGLLQITDDNVTITCEPGAVLHGPLQFFGDASAPSSTTEMTTTGTPFAGRDLTGYTIYNNTDGESCTVTSNTDNTVTCTGGLSGAGQWDDTDDYALELDVLSTVFFSGDNVAFRNCEVDGGLPNTDTTTVNLGSVDIQKHGVRLVGSDNFWVENNYFHDLNHAGVITTSASNGIIRGNHTLRTGRYGSTPAVSTSENGIQVYTDSDDSDTHNILIQGNLVEKFTGNGIALRKQDQNDVCRDIVIDANIIRDQENANGSCVNPFGGDGVVISNTVARNCRLHITGDGDFLKNGTSESINSVRNVSINDFVLDNTDWTVTAEDVKVGEFAEGLKITNLTVFSAGNDYCIDFDPPWIGLSMTDIELHNCQDNALYFTNISASDHALGASGTGASLTDDPAYTPIFRNWKIIDPQGSIVRFIGDVPVRDWVWDGLEITGFDGTNEHVLYFINSAADYDRVGLRFSDWFVEGSSTGNIIDQQDTGSPTIGDWRLRNIVADGIGGYVLDLDAGTTSIDNLKVTDSECRGSGCDGFLFDPTATNVFLHNVECPDATNGCSSNGIAVKTADETITLDSTSNTDSELQFYARAGLRYEIRGMLYYTTTENADFKWNPTCPTLTDANVVQQRKVGGSTSVQGNITNWSNCSFSAAQIALGTGTQSGYVEFLIHIQPSANGTFGIQWAQNTTHADSTTLENGSYLEWRQIP